MLSTLTKMKTWFFSLALVLGLAMLGASAARALPATAATSTLSTAAPAQTTTSAKPQESTAEVMDAPESEHDINEYRFSPSVQKLAHWIHQPVERTSEWIEDLNSIILFLVIFYFLFKWMPKVFRNRSERIAKELVDAQGATEQANERLKVIEQRLSHLDTDIASYRERTEHDMVEEEKRMRVSLETERQRIVSSAEAEIDQARSGAERELRRYAAELALEQARREITISPAEDERLIASFGESLAQQNKEGAR